MDRYNKQKRKFYIACIILLVLFIGIGYAALMQTLTLDNTISYDSMKWEVGFSEVVDNGGTKPSTGNIIDNGKSITVSCDIGMSTKQESCIVKAKITNNSTFDIALFEEPIITYDSQNIHTVTFKWNDHTTYDNYAVHKNDYIKKGETEEVILTIKTKNLNEDMLSLDPLSIEIKVSLNFQEWQGGELPEKEDLAVLKATNCDVDLENIILSCESSAGIPLEYAYATRNLTFERGINIPDNAIEQWDISEAQNGSVIAYALPNEESSSFYDLYIQSDTQLYANKDMSLWFTNYTSIKTISGLELIDTSMTTNMFGMFFSLLYVNDSLAYNLESLDVSSFDTSNVTNMDGMFNCAGYKSTNFTLDVSNFDTSNVMSMWAMFYSTGYNSTNFTLDVSNFDTSKVNDMAAMFNRTGYNSTIFTLDVSNFDTSKVTDMTSMFSNTGYNSTNFTLDVSNFDTSNVTSMSNMFHRTGYNSEIFTLDLSNFDTSNVTNMRWMFAYVGYNNPNFTLDVSDFDTSNVTDMTSMFYYTGYSSTKFNTTITIRNPNIIDYQDIFYYVATKLGTKLTVNYTSETSELVDQMIATKSSNSNVVKGNSSVQKPDLNTDPM